MSEGLGTFRAPSAGGFVKATPYKVADHVDRPLIMVVRELKENFSTTQYPNPRDVIFVMLADVMENKVYVNTLIGPAAIVDRLKGYAGTNEKLPVKFVKVVRPGKNDYFTVEGLTGDQLKVATLWDAKYPTRIADERAAAEALAAAEAADEAAGSAPLSGLGNSAPATQAVPDSELEAMMASLNA